MSSQNYQQHGPITPSQRQRAVADALASVRAENLEPSIATQQRLKKYALGEITAEELRQGVVAEQTPSTHSTD